MPAGLTNEENAEYDRLGELAAIAREEVKRLGRERHKLVMRGKARRISRIAHLLRTDLEITRISSLPEYAIWRSMIDRCHNPKNPSYCDYGERGIAVCERWRASFEDFLLDVGRRPSDELSLDRRNNDAGYAPGNCRWTTRKVQMANRRPNRPQSPRPSRRQAD